MTANFDYIVVGSGAAGAAAAWRFSEKNADVLILELGDYVNSNDYPTANKNWEQLKNAKFNPVASIRKGLHDYPVDDGDSPISVCNFNAVGGSTILFSAHFPRFLRADFSIKTDHNIGVDWPISYDSLLPYFDINEKEMALSGLPGDPYYPEIESALPPVPLGKVGETLAKGFNQLGWHWWPSFAAISTRERSGRSKCINLGPCNAGCPQQAKSSVDQTYLKRAKSNGVTLISKFSVSKILVEDDVAVGVEGFDETGTHKIFYGNKIVLAASAIGTPRILLNSNSEGFPNGLANSSGLVGKNLMVHPLGYVEGVFNDYLEADSGPQGCMLYSLEHHRSPDSDHKLGYMMHALRGGGPVEIAKAALGRKKLRFGDSLYSDFKKFYGKQSVVAIICEDVPEVKNQVMLDYESLDRFGQPGVKVAYQLHENTKKMLIHGMGNARKLMKESGAVKSYAHGPVKNTGWHIMGTCKMGLDPQQSVVDVNGQTHDVKNLFILDSSVFPTSSCVNPANTIQAVALYLADKIYEL